MSASIISVGNLRRIMRAGTMTMGSLGVLAIILSTHQPLREEAGAWIDGFVLATSGFFAFDLAVLIVLAWGATGDERRHHALGALIRAAGEAGLVDLLAMIAVPLPLLAGIPPETADLFGLIWLVKLARAGQGVGLVVRVLRNSAESLISVMLCFGIVLICAAAGAYLAEREVQPEQFGSIPLAIWWAIVTLTTTGYGDVTPVTLPGRLLAGVVMVCGIGVFALWAGIIASGFVDELKRRDFLRNWELVAQVPFFHELGAEIIAEVVSLLRRRDLSKGQTIMRKGQPGDAMFFIVEGEVEVQIPSKPIRLGEGHFFGEMALIADAPRSATVVAAKATVLLELDIVDFRRLSGQRPELMQAIAHEAERRRGGKPAA